MSKKNYNNQYIPKNEPVVEVPEYIQGTEEATAEPVIEKDIFGTVSHCEQLNIRSSPDRYADNVITKLPVNTEVKINKEFTDSKWLRITTATGVDGYCMKQFIALPEENY